MFTRRTLTVWTGIIILSSIFLMGQETWAPSDLIYCEDLDSDGYGARWALLCPFVLYLDCDDADPDVHPFATEICNGIDDNCDTVVDFVDADGDTYFSNAPPCSGTDCDDTNPSIHPGAVEICDGLDNNCDTVIPVDETDFDSDQYVECGPWVGTLPGILGGYDCNDSSAAMSPGLIEAAYGDPMCSDWMDNDCDTFTDIADNGCQQCTLPVDCDDSNPCTDEACVTSLCQYTYNTIPCDDGDDCTMDDTCSLGVCTGVPLDGDGDSYVSDACPGGDDCLDSNLDVNPGATEGPAGDGTCIDGLDNDCDGLTDTAQDPDCVVP